MAEHEHHCPFLNRPDERCSAYFHVDKMEHAFRHCVDEFEACPVYAERREERQIRRQVDVLEGIIAQGNLHATHNSHEADHAEPTRGRPLVQVTISANISTRIAKAFRRPKATAQRLEYAESAAATEELPALSGV
jgi:hypothetical protein